MDLRKCINLISDIVNNRPMPIREFDQIYMKHADMILQIEHIGKWLNEKRIVFIGDGDAIALGLAYLQTNGEVTTTVKEILVLDFDQRIVNSINSFAEMHDMSEKISSRLYNVADALPVDLWRQYDCFYCNPPFGASNKGASITSFMQRGFEATVKGALGFVVLADVPELKWTRDVIGRTQKFALDSGFVIAEMIPEFHSYHLDDDPDIKSCSIVFRRNYCIETEYNSIPLSEDDLKNFYGIDVPLSCQYVRDITERKYIQPDYELIPMNKE